ncbi:MAG TPA: type IV toxin-antitoxin system AbiEi family antitoxin [Cellulomonas sp.]
MPEVRRLIARRTMRTVRPVDLAGVYADPRAVLRRLERDGAVHRMAFGYYCEVPADADPATWMPSLESAAMAIAAARGGPGEPVLMGMSAARVHGALPRAIATAGVAVDAAGRRPVRLLDRTAVIRFSQRATARVDAERVLLDLGPALVTTPEQTLLDLLRFAPDDPETPAAVRALWARVDEAVLADVARAGRGAAALSRAQAMRA